MTNNLEVTKDREPWWELSAIPDLTAGKVAITFIGTNQYLDFFPNYYSQIEKFFLPNSEKVFLVFTDGEIDDPPDNVKVFHQEHLEWPYITLKRFEIINKARSIIKDCDWLFFLDADTLVVKEFKEAEFLFRCCNADIDSTPLFGVHHPCHNMRMKPHDEEPGAYDQNPESEAYVDMDDEDFEFKAVPYIQGCFWGGRIPAVLGMIDELEARVNRDLEKGVVALWHDESHLNKYLTEHEFAFHIFGPEFAFPEVFRDHCNFKPRIVHLQKDNSAYQI